ncbi:MAG: hypothetical protein F6K65_43320 [Moorea sp. SIO3C2]|nr:hypothetical protein [Moorena sp. SIO3C2]
MSTLIEKIASDEVIDIAYQWLCQKRAHYHPNADVWQVRRWWHEKKPLIQGQIRSGHYQFRELLLIRCIEAYFQRWWRWVKGGISAHRLSVIPSCETQRVMELTRAPRFKGWGSRSAHR